MDQCSPEIFIDRIIKYGGQFKHIFWNIAADYLFICLFTMLCMKIKLVPYIRYQVSAKAKRKTRAQPGQMWQRLDEPEQ